MQLIYWSTLKEIIEIKNYSVTYNLLLNLNSLIIKIGHVCQQNNYTICNVTFDLHCSCTVIKSGCYSSVHYTKDNDIVNYINHTLRLP